MNKVASRPQGLSSRLDRPLTNSRPSSRPAAKMLGISPSYMAPDPKTKKSNATTASATMTGSRPTDTSRNRILEQLVKEARVYNKDHIRVGDLPRHYLQSQADPVSKVGDKVLNLNASSYESLIQGKKQSMIDAGKFRHLGISRDEISSYMKETNDEHIEVPEGTEIWHAYWSQPRFFQSLQTRARHLQGHHNDHQTLHELGIAAILDPYGTDAGLMQADVTGALLGEQLAKGPDAVHYLLSGMLGRQITTAECIGAGIEKATGQKQKLGLCATFNETSHGPGENVCQPGEQWKSYSNSMGDPNKWFLLDGVESDVQLDARAQEDESRFAIMSLLHDMSEFARNYKNGEPNAHRRPLHETYVTSCEIGGHKDAWTHEQGGKGGAFLRMDNCEARTRDTFFVTDPSTGTIVQKARGSIWDEKVIGPGFSGHEYNSRFKPERITDVSRLGEKVITIEQALNDPTYMMEESINEIERSLHPGGALRERLESQNYDCDAITRDQVRSNYDSLQSTMNEIAAAAREEQKQRFEAIAQAFSNSGTSSRRSIRGTGSANSRNTSGTSRPSMVQAY